jgi:Ca2+-binding RTX toxin-like protein
MEGFGNALANVIRGNTLANSLSGGYGNDTLVGGFGKDTLTGGLGADIFDFDLVTHSTVGSAGRDVIMDFTVGQDHIDLRSIDASSQHSGNNTFTFIGTKFYSSAGGEVRFFTVNREGTANDRTFVAGDINGDRVGDFMIELVGLKSLTAGDFLL